MAAAAHWRGAPLGDRGRGLGLSEGLDDWLAMTHLVTIDA